MLLSCDVGEDSWKSLGLQRDPSSPSERKSVLNIHWKDWCWSWNSNPLATWCEELTYWKRPWCWERLRVGREGDNREWDIDAITDSIDMGLGRLQQFVMDREVWRAGVHGVAQSQIWLSDWTELNRCVVGYHYSINLHFPHDWWYWTYFLMLICHSSLFFGKVLIQICWLFFPY